MTTIGTSVQATEPGGAADEAVATKLSRRDSLEPLALLLGIFGIILALALTMGASIPTGQ